jgi:hypothetical protein
MAGKESAIDDKRFFFAPDGKSDPQQELKATLGAIFRDPSLGDDHPRCLFPGRYSWLKEKLPIDEGRLPQVSCKKLDDALANISTGSADLVFPASYINSPASMFGHTLIKINSTYQSDLLAYAVNYSAFTDETNGFIYAWKGIFGLYSGYFSILPYYEKVREYNDLEHRDMWEYRLNLTQAEVRRMALHVWELQGMASDYYFFNENCSYNLLFLLEAARPSVRLTEGLSRWWVIPTDTLRQVKDEGLISERRYRPSQGTRIRHLAANMTLNQQRLAREIAWKRLAAQDAVALKMEESELIQTLDMAAELLQFRYGRKELEKEEFNRQFLAVLKLRSPLGKGVTDDKGIEPPPPPEEGHGTAKMALSGGVRSGSPFVELGGHLAYHGLSDPDAGYIEGAQIRFGSADVRYYPKRDEVQLQSFRLVDIVSLSPRDLIFRPYSWKVAVGGDQETHRDGSEHLLYRINSGGGFTIGGEGRGLTYILAEIDLNAGDRLKDKYALGVGATGGYLLNLNGFWKGSLSLQGFYYGVGDKHSLFRGTLGQSFRLSRNNSLELSLIGERSYGDNRGEVKGGWNYYF